MAICGIMHIIHRRQVRRDQGKGYYPYLETKSSRLNFYFYFLLVRRINN